MALFFWHSLEKYIKHPYFTIVQLLHLVEWAVR